MNHDSHLGADEVRDPAPVPSGSRETGCASQPEEVAAARPAEGTPVSPPFATKEDLAAYLAVNGDWWDQSRGHGGWGAERAAAFVSAGWAPSFISDGVSIEEGKLMKEERVQKKSTTLYFSKPVWLALKNAAAEQDTSMTALVEEILADRLGVSVIHPIDADPGGAHDEPTTEEERLLMELEGLESEGEHRKDPPTRPKATRARKRTRQGNG